MALLVPIEPLITQKRGTVCHILTWRS